MVKTLKIDKSEISRSVESNLLWGPASWELELGDAVWRRLAPGTVGTLELQAARVIEGVAPVTAVLDVARVRHHVRAQVQHRQVGHVRVQLDFYGTVREFGRNPAH